MLLHILAIKIEPNFTIENYWHWFDKQTILSIQQFRQRKDQVMAFASALVKRYYLAKILDLAPQYININYNHHQRPFLDNHPKIDFNISHSGDYLVIAISDTAKLGVDIECQNNQGQLADLSPLVFSKSEQSLVANNNDNFLCLWTKKEALLKARGVGFASEEYLHTNLTLNNFDELLNTIIYSSKMFSYYTFAICLVSE